MTQIACNWIPALSTGQAFVGEVRVGNNSLSPAEHEFDVGTNTSGDFVKGQRVWDADPSDGLDSGWVDFILVGNPAGGAGGVTLTVGSSTITYDNASYHFIEKVQVRAKAAIPGVALYYRALTAQFYRNGQLAETQIIDESCQPIATTLQSGNDAEQILEILPESSDYTKVVVSAQIWLRSNPGVIPQRSQINGNIYVFASAPA